MKKIIAIDGPAGSGKSTVAKKLSNLLGLPYIDTGAMYRALTLACLDEDIDFKNEGEIIAIAKKAKIDLKLDKGEIRVYLDKEDVTKKLHKPIVDSVISYVARIPQVRAEMVKRQRNIGKERGAVMEGRDIGTVVFPDADYKFYLDADFETRVLRRYKELISEEENISRARIRKDLKIRDESDLKREIGPLRKAEDAVYIDTTNLSVEGVIREILQIINPVRNSHGGLDFS
jgi:cytidylate kinase